MREGKTPTQSVSTVQYASTAIDIEGYSFVIKKTGAATDVAAKARNDHYFRIVRGLLHARNHSVPGTIHESACVFQP